ncbi:MAG: hypothetical protein FJ253_03100 [Phycisphaerae bacterium]|nr:hypothetical protein [Phycisphaerae bacterium]
MHAAAQPDIASKEPAAADADPLPLSNNPVKPDRGDWEFLMRSVGSLRMRPTDACEPKQSH